MVITILLFILSYFLGSFPTAVWYAKLFHGIDIREHGSGNAGATNSLRVLGKKAGIVVLLFDVVKGYLPVYLFKTFSETPDLAFLVGIVAILGHVYSVFSGFKGGKGIATSLGVILAVQPVGALISVVAFVLTVAVSKYVSLGSLMAALVFNIYISFFIESPILIMVSGWFLLALLVYTHRTNIKKLIAGTENKINAKKAGE
jgi:acyl phosphate:glycerol-3-phosphate acyltransferase